MSTELTINPPDPGRDEPQREKHSVNQISRAKAALIHLALSAVIAAVVVCLMLFLWYPSPYFSAMGGGMLLLLIVGVDVVIGPLITLIIFDQKKKSLRFDLSVIGIIQLAALVYGAAIMFQARPAFIGYHKDRFEVITPARIPTAELARVTNPEYQSLPLAGPKIVALKMPIDRDEGNRIMFHPNAAADFLAFPQHYVPYAEKAKEAAFESKPLEMLKKKNPQIETELNALLAKRGVVESKAGYLPLNTKSNDMAVIVEKETGKILGMIFSDPW